MLGEINSTMLPFALSELLIKFMTIIWLASILDYLIGNPKNWYHPVQLIGWIIEKSVNFVIHQTENKTVRKIAGVILGLVLVLGSGVITWLIIYLLSRVNFWLGFVFQVILLASCFAGRSLSDAAEDVLSALKENNLSEARHRLSFYVGRDTDNLSTEEIYRAVLETVSENATDGVTAPLFYALLGSFIPIVGCVPSAIAYKTLSTLDSMIGYKREPYQDIGWFSAKWEDYITWLPCRLTVLTLGLISLNPIYNIKECRKYAIQDPSPNSGWSEGIYAVILKVQLGGENSYQGVKKFKPLLGKPEREIDEKVIKKALFLTHSCFLLWLLLGVLIFSIIYLSLS